MREPVNQEIGIRSLAAHLPNPHPPTCHSPGAPVSQSDRLCIFKGSPARELKSASLQIWSLFSGERKKAKQQMEK